MADQRIIILRAAAKQRGLLRYFDGTRCKRGHLSDRYVSTGYCVECMGNGPERTLARKEAQRSGAQTYNGSVCKKDPAHGAVRYTSNGSCVRCESIKSAATYAPKRSQRQLLLPEEKHRRKLKCQKVWRTANAEHAAAYDNEYKSRKLQQDINYKLKMALRNRVNRAVIRNSKAGSAVRDLGCTIPKFREHIEAQFRDGMTWGNWGVGPGKWHLDHIKPLAELDLRKREDFLIAARWTNYRPLWSEENSGRRTNIGRGKLGASKRPEAAP